MVIATTSQGLPAADHIAASAFLATFGVLLLLVLTGWIWIPLMEHIIEARNAKRGVHQQREREAQLRAASHKIQHHRGYSRRLEPGEWHVVYPSQYEQPYRSPRDFSPLYCVVAPRGDAYTVTQYRQRPMSGNIIEVTKDPGAYPTAGAEVDRAVETMKAAPAREAEHRARRLEEA